VRIGESVVSPLRTRLQNGTNALASVRKCKTPEVRFCALLSRKGSNLQLALWRIFELANRLGLEFRVLLSGSGTEIGAVTNVRGLRP
jgi:hypothetical protein